MKELMKRMSRKKHKDDHHKRHRRHERDRRHRSKKKHDEQSDVQLPVPVEENTDKPHGHHAHDDDKRDHGKEVDWKDDHETAEHEEVDYKHNKKLS